MATTRQVTTNIRHAATGKVLPVRWNAPQGMTAKEATAYLMQAQGANGSPNVITRLATLLGVKASDITFAVTARTDLSEGVVRLANEQGTRKAATPSTPSKAATPSTEQMIQAFLLEYMPAHPNTTYAQALKLATEHAAQAVTRAAIADLDTRIAALTEQVTALMTERASLVKSMTPSKGQARKARKAVTPDNAPSAPDQPIV